MIRRNGKPLRGWQMALLLLAVLALLAVLIYQLPPVKQRLSWRIDFAMTYIRGVFNPVEALPTAVLETSALPHPGGNLYPHPTSGHTHRHCRTFPHPHTQPDAAACLGHPGWADL